MPSTTRSAPVFRDELHERWGAALDKADVYYEYEGAAFDLRKMGLYPGVGIDLFIPTFYLPLAKRILHVISPQAKGKLYDPYLYAVAALGPHLWAREHRITLAIGEPPRKLPYVTVTYMKASQADKMPEEDLERSFASYGSRGEVFSGKQVISPKAGGQGNVLSGYATGLKVEDFISELGFNQLVRHGLLGIPWVPSEKMLRNVQEGNWAV